jgi:hypothetical protein
MAGVLICYFIVAWLPHRQDDPFALVFTLNYFVSYAFFLSSTSVFDAQVNAKIRLPSAHDILPGLQP